MKQLVYDVIVIGGGHAGIEAAHAAARLGSQTALITLHPDKIGSMPCNPSIGGLGKGHIVYEVSALGGLMPKLCTQTYLQARMLNTSKGPAVQGLRLQIDKYAYSRAACSAMADLPNLTIIPAMVQRILVEEQQGVKRIVGIVCTDGQEIRTRSLVVTTGTFMNGVAHVGYTRYKAGRRGEAGSYGLSESISQAMGVPIERLKTGTPPRIKASSIDFSVLEKQSTPHLDYLFEFDPVKVEEKAPCYIAKTIPETNRIIEENMCKAPVYVGKGPRYCPSIEVKVKRFPDRTSHHVFIEPESLECDEIYPAGLSTGLPLDIQQAFIRSIPGLEQAEIVKCAYAIEYDFFQPNNLRHSLETKQVNGLFLAGQIIGTTGYEEAAGLGMMAGINAHLAAHQQDPFILSRTESYIGVMIDDLVTLGADEPYRMFTSRAERRLLLRQDNVFARLMPHGYRLGLIPEPLYQKFLAEQHVIDSCRKILSSLDRLHELIKLLHAVEFTSEVQQKVHDALVQKLHHKQIDAASLSSRALLTLHAEVRYAGYLEKEEREVAKIEQYQQLEIDPALFVTDISGLTGEMKEKLACFKPRTIAQAQLIPGMTPSALSILIFQSRKNF